jgi:selenocysteine-specific elongation factor
VIVGTAGHVDHGKTALVRALTGVDTDRLPEEKARGISIELGYAYAPLDGGGTLGFVDVPGHERFVHAMLAGATGIDHALLVVAADDGVMPQTREHLDILSLLGVRAGAIALTKVDLVDAARCDEVEHDLRALTRVTPLDGAPVFRVAAPSGQGIDALRAHLDRSACTHRRHDAAGQFRLAVDRSFALAGIGTVVTGTVHSGEVAVGATLRIVPGEHVARVRSIHAQNRAATHAVAGERCALNLAGLHHGEIARGDWVVAAPIAFATPRFDAEITLLPGVELPSHGSLDAHVHVGAAHRTARVVALEEGQEAGAPRLVQVVAGGSLGAWYGDRFVLRDAGAMRTLGGGRVLDPFAPARHRRAPERIAELAAMRIGDPCARLAALAALAPFGVDVAAFAQAHNVVDIDALLQPLPLRRFRGNGEDRAVAHAQAAALATRIVEALQAFHRDHHDQRGPDLARLRRITLPRASDAVVRGLVDDLIAEGRIRRSGAWLHLPGHGEAASAAERRLVDLALPRLLDRPLDPPWVRELARDLRVDEAALRVALLRAARRGETFQVVRDLFYHPAALRELADLATALQAADGDVRAAAFRDRMGLGRKRAIQVLEFFDRTGFTRRVGERHLVRGDNPWRGADVPAQQPTSDVLE